MTKLIIIYGNVSAGKGTLATEILKHFPGTRYFCSDGIRTELSDDIGGKSKGTNHLGVHFDTFQTLRERVENAMTNPGIVIADSTGMSADFVKMVNAWRLKYDDITVVRLHCSYNIWTEREKNRLDRWKLSGESIIPFQMPERAYYGSYAAKFDDIADIEIDTSHLTPDQVYEEFLDRF